MAKIVRLTESDLVRLVRRIVNEQDAPVPTENSYSLMVNGQDLNTTVKMFELYSAKKPFTNKECFYIDSGNNNFKPQNYDVTKNQAIFDKDGKKFEKGENMRLAQYLDDAGWVESGSRQTTQGDVPVSVVRYKRKS